MSSQSEAFLSVTQLLVHMMPKVYKFERIQSPTSRQEIVLLMATNKVLPSDACRPFSLVSHNIFNWDIPKPPARVYEGEEIATALVTSLHSCDWRELWAESPISEARFYFRRCS